MTRDDEAKEEAAIGRAIRLSCEGLGVALGEADDMANRAIGSLRVRKAGDYKARAALHIAVCLPAPSRHKIERKACPKTKAEPVDAKHESKLVDHLIARWHST